MAIRSFGDAKTEAVFNGSRAARIPVDVARRARAKLQVLDAAASPNDLRVPPGNRLEALRGDLAGKYSIRINDQWRIVFRWKGADAYDVLILDYH